MEVRLIDLLSTGNGTFPADHLQLLCAERSLTLAKTGARVPQFHSSTFGALHPLVLFVMGWEKAIPHVPVRVMQTTNRLSVRGLLNVSLSFSLLHCQYLNASDHLVEALALDGQLTIVPLGNPILYTTSLGKVRDLRPVLIGICTRTEGTAGTM